MHIPGKLLMLFQDATLFAMLFVGITVVVTIIYNSLINY